MGNGDFVPHDTMRSDLFLSPFFPTSLILQDLLQIRK